MTCRAFNPPARLSPVAGEMMWARLGLRSRLSGPRLRFSGALGKDRSIMRQRRYNEPNPMGWAYWWFPGLLLIAWLGGKL